MSEKGSSMVAVKMLQPRLCSKTRVSWNRFAYTSWLSCCFSRCTACRISNSSDFGGPLPFCAPRPSKHCDSPRLVLSRVKGRPINIVLSVSPDMYDYIRKPFLMAMEFANHGELLSYLKCQPNRTSQVGR